MRKALLLAASSFLSCANVGEKGYDRKKTILGAYLATENKIMYNDLR